MNILPLCRIHENKIVRAFQFFQNSGGITCKQGDCLLLSRPPEIFKSLGNSFFIFFYGGNLAALWPILAHKERGKPNGSSHLQNLPRLFYGKQKL